MHRLFYRKKPNCDHNNNEPHFIAETFVILNAKRPSWAKIKWWQDFSVHGKANLDPQSRIRYKLYPLILPGRSSKQLFQWKKSFFPMGRSLNYIPMWCKVINTVFNIALYYLFRDFSIRKSQTVTTTITGHTS